MTYGLVIFFQLHFIERTEFAFIEFDKISKNLKLEVIYYLAIKYMDFNLPIIMLLGFLLALNETHVNRENGQ